MHWELQSEELEGEHRSWAGSTAHRAERGLQPRLGGGGRIHFNWLQKDKACTSVWIQRKAHTGETCELKAVYWKNKQGSSFMRLEYGDKWLIGKCNPDGETYVGKLGLSFVCSREPQRSWLLTVQIHLPIVTLEKWEWWIGREMIWGLKNMQVSLWWEDAGELLMCQQITPYISRMFG